MNPFTSLLIRFLIVVGGVFCAVPAFAQHPAETLDISSLETEADEDSCTSERYCEQLAPLQVFILTLMRCTEEPIEGTCEVLPDLPSSLFALRKVLLIQTPSHPNSPNTPNFAEKQTKHDQAPTQPIPQPSDERALQGTLCLFVPPVSIKTLAPILTFDAPLSCGVQNLPETPG